MGPMPEDFPELWYGDPQEVTEELAQSRYYRECRDYWRTQAESLAERWDKHMRAKHNTLSHEQMFDRPEDARG